MSFANATCGPDSMRAIAAKIWIDTAICLGGSASLRGQGGITYAWSSGVGDTLPNITVSPTATTSYTLTVTNGTCLTSIDTVIVSVGTPPTANAGIDRAICVGDSAQIGSTTSTSSVTGGNGTGNLNGPPFQTSYEDEKTQLLFLASELQASGMTAGFLTHLAFNVVQSTSTKAMSNFTLALQNVTNSDLSGGFVGSPTQVLSLASYTPLVRWDTLYFDTPFFWDGSSNLLVQTCFDNSGSPSTNGYIVKYTVTSGSMVAFYRGTGGCSQSALYASTSRANIKFFYQANKYEWNPTAGLDRSIISNPKASPSSTTTYTLTVTDALGCSGSDAVDVTVYPTNPTSLTWTGAVSNNWNTAGNWNVPCAVPTAGDSITIPTGATPPASIPSMTLGKVTLDNTAGVSLGGDVTITGNLTLTNGKILLGSHNLIMGASGVINGAGASNFIATDGTGELRKLYSAAGSFSFAVGDVTGTAEYSPVDLNFTGGSFGSGAYAGVRVVNSKHTSNMSAVNYLTRYWKVAQNNISGFSCNAAFTYLDADIAGNENSLWTGAFNGTSWSRKNHATVSSNQLSGNGLSSFSDFTGGDIYSMDAKLTVNARAFLEGSWNGASGMNAYLVSTDSTSTYLPRVQPYSATWGYSGTENVPGINWYSSHTDIVDWILVELRSTASGSTVDQRAGFLKSDGTIVDVDGASPLAFPTASPGAYFIVVRHRDHLSIMSASAQSLSLSSLTYNFTTSQSQAYGTNPMKLLGTGQYGAYAGDGTYDGYINYTDEEGIAWNDRNLMGYYLSDYTMDGYVNYTDEEGLAWNNRNTASHVP
jgi:hypothetical protein